MNPIVKITGLSHEGRSIAHLEGKTIFIEGGLMGEEVEIAYLKKRSRWDEARIVNVIVPSVHRVSPECAFFEYCGGCSLQHMDSVLQISHKQAMLLDQLQHMGRVIPKAILPATTAVAYGYRRKARLGVRYVDKKEKLLLGFREKNGRYLADIDDCPVLDPSIGKKIPLLRDFLCSLEGYRQIPQLEIAIGDQETAIIIRHLKPFSDKDLTLIKAFAALYQFQIYLQPKGPESANLFYPSNARPRLSYPLTEYNLEILFHPTDFTQVNQMVNQKLIKLALELLQPSSNEILWDLFCGIGNFTLPLARFCQHVVGIEGSQLMVERGYENAAHNHLTNVEFHCRNLAEKFLIDKLQAPSAILLDPPRAGAWEVIQRMPQTTAKRIVYVSCNSATFARDAGFLTQHGFELSQVGVLDMFPHTSHVESIALFTRV